MKSIKYLFIVSAVLILVVGMSLIDYGDISLSNNNIPYILIITGILGVIITIIIKPIKDKNKQKIVLALLECMAFVYGAFYIVFIIEEPTIIVGYLKLIPVMCIFLFVRMVRRSIKQRSKEIE